MSKIKVPQKGYLELSLIIGLAIFSLIFWETPIVYPIKIFIVLMHEINHAIIAIFTGGSVESIRFSLNLSGLTITKGGNLLLIASAGYLGSLILGVLLYLSADMMRLRKWLTAGLSITILVVTVNLIEGGVQIFLSLLIALFFFILPRYINEKFIKLFLKFIGLTSCLYVLVDIKQDLLTTTLRETDTQILEYILGVPALLIGFIWFIVSIIVVVFMIKKSFNRDN